MPALAAYAASAPPAFPADGAATFYTELQRHRDSDGHSARFEALCWVERLVLDEQVLDPE